MADEGGRQQQQKIIIKVVVEIEQHKARDIGGRSVLKQRAALAPGLGQGVAVPAIGVGQDIDRPVIEGKHIQQLFGPQGQPLQGMLFYPGHGPTTPEGPFFSVGQHGVRGQVSRLALFKNPGRVAAACFVVGAHQDVDRAGIRPGYELSVIVFNAQADKDNDDQGAQGHQPGPGPGLPGFKTAQKGGHGMGQGPGQTDGADIDRQGGQKSGSGL